MRRLVGIDLGIASLRTVRVLDEAGREVCRRKCEPTVAGFAAIEAAALAGALAGTRLEVVIEPSGPAWLPVAATPAEAKRIIAEQWTVPAEVRARRRSTKKKTTVGKAPQQVHTGHDRSHAQGADETRRPSPGRSSKTPRPRSSTAGPAQVTA